VAIFQTVSGSMNSQKFASRNSHMADDSGSGFGWRHAEAEVTPRLGGSSLGPLLPLFTQGVEWDFSEVSLLGVLGSCGTKGPSFDRSFEVFAAFLMELLPPVQATNWRCRQPCRI
jgi:hypothetical protein